MKLAEYVADFLVTHGIRHIFMVTGGGAMHLNHALGTHPDLHCVFNHHEQACAMAAESYYRLDNRLAVVNVTSGPGGSNALTGVYGAWTDSIGMIVLSGQVKYATTIRSTGLPLRQFGDQEIDIVPLASPITKYCVSIDDPSTIRYHLEKAFFLAKHGRPGPCWLDIPLDVQSAIIDPATLPAFIPEPELSPWQSTNLEQTADVILQHIAQAKRPVIMVGTGIRLSGMHASLLDLVDHLKIPVVTGWGAHDVFWNEHPCYVGRPGTIGDRAGNFAVQNSDLLLVLGCRLNIRQISYNWKSFARFAFKIWVDIDALELQKPSVRPDLPVHANLTELIPILNERSILYKKMENQQLMLADWLDWCKKRSLRYPVVLPEYAHAPEVNPYVFMEEMYKNLPEQQIIVAANATASVAGFQAAYLKPYQRLWANSGCAAMGYDLPAAIGACIAAEKKPVVCLAGDGSIMMNLQELQTISSNRLPIKIFLLNNSGYVSIFQTQKNFFNGDEVGAGPKSGVQFPEFSLISKAFSIPYTSIRTHAEIAAVVRNTLAMEGPVFCEVFLDKDQPFAPKLASRILADGTIISPPLEDLAPFLSRQELLDNMLIPPNPEMT